MQPLLLCARSKDLSFTPSFSTFGKCSGCGERVVMSPGSVKLRDAGAKPVCNVCFAKMPVMVLHMMTEEQVRDLRVAEEERRVRSN